MSEETTEGQAPKAPKRAAAKKPATAAKTTRARKAPAKTTTAAKRTTAKKPVAKPKAAPKSAAARVKTVQSDDTSKKVEDSETVAEAEDMAQGADAAADDHSHQHGGNGFSAEQLKHDLKDKDWAGYAIRGLLMVLFGFLAWFATLANFVLAGVQFVILVLTGGPNELIRKIIMVLGRYIVDVMQYLSFESDEPPFPLGKDFPEMDD